MTLPDIEEVTSADEAKQLAMDWQDWQSEQAMGLGEVSGYQDYFEALADKFPGLRAEYIENGIIGKVTE